MNVVYVIIGGTPSWVLLVYVLIEFRSIQSECFINWLKLHYIINSSKLTNIGYYSNLAHLDLSTKLIVYI